MCSPKVDNFYVLRARDDSVDVNESNQNSIFVLPFNVQSNEATNHAKYDPNPDQTLILYRSFADCPNLGPQQNIKSHALVSDRNYLDAIREFSDEDDPIFVSQPFVCNSQSSSDADDTLSPITKYVRKMLAKKALSTSSGTINNENRRLCKEDEAEKTEDEKRKETVTANGLSIAAVCVTPPLILLEPQLETKSPEDWTPPRNRRVRNTPSPECPEVVTPENSFLKRFSKDPEVIYAAERLYFEQLERERPFWPQSLFHSDDSDDSVKTKRQSSIQEASGSRSADQPNKYVQYTNTDEKPFTCTVCDRSFPHKLVLKQHKSVFHNPKYMEKMPKEKIHKCPLCPRSFIRKKNLKQHLDNHGPDSVVHREGSASQPINEQVISVHEDEELKEEEEDDGDKVGLSFDDSDSM